MKYFFENRKQALSYYVSDCLDYRAHLHEHFEMGYLMSGTCRMTVENKSFDLHASDFFMVFPNQIHSYSDSENVRVYMMIFSTGIVPEFRKIFSEYVPDKPTLRAAGDIEKLTEIFFADLNRSAEFCRGMLLAICGSALEHAKLVKSDNSNADTIKSVLMYVDAHFTEPINIESVSHDLHISRSHISHMFRAKLDTTFSKYLTEKRIGYACGLLRNGDITVTDAALNSGFGSIRTFNRVFTEYVGVSPRRFRG